MRTVTLEEVRRRALQPSRGLPPGTLHLFCQRCTRPFKSLSLDRDCSACTRAAAKAFGTPQPRMEMGGM